MRLDVAKVVSIFALSFILLCFSLVLPIPVLPFCSLVLRFSVIPFLSFLNYAFSPITAVSISLLFLVTFMLIITVLILLTARCTFRFGDSGSWRR
jgi:hypothetical protein